MTIFLVPGLLPGRFHRRLGPLGGEDPGGNPGPGGTPIQGPLNLIAPSISAPNVYPGTVATCSPGSWSGFPTPILTYQWYRDGSQIPNAQNPTYMFQVADVGKVITCRVFAFNSAGADDEYSNALSPVAMPTGSALYAWVEDPIPGLESARVGDGRTSTASQKTIVANGVPAGCTLDSTYTNWLHVTVPGTVIEDWNLEGYTMDIEADNVTVRQNLFDWGGPPRWGSKANRDHPATIRIMGGATNYTIEHNTWDGKKTNNGSHTCVFQVEATGQGTVRYNKIFHMPSDGITGVQGIIEFNAIFENGYIEGCHMDPIEMSGTETAATTIRYNYLDGTIPADAPASVQNMGLNNSGNDSCIKCWEEPSPARKFNNKVDIHHNVLVGGVHQIMTVGQPDGKILGTSYVHIHNNWFGDNGVFGGSGSYITNAAYSPGFDIADKVLVENNGLLFTGAPLPFTHALPVAGPPPVDPPPPDPAPTGASAVYSGPQFLVPGANTIVGHAYRGDYAVGRTDFNAAPPAATATLPAGVTRDTTNRDLRINQSGVVLDNIDMRDGWTISFAGGITSWTVRRCLFTNKRFAKFINPTYNPNGNYFYAIDCANNDPAGGVVELCSFEGIPKAQQGTTPAEGAIAGWIAAAKQGITVRNNVFTFTPNDQLKVKAATIQNNFFYGGGQQTGAHYDIIQLDADVTGPIEISGNHVIGQGDGSGEGATNILRLVQFAEGAGQTRNYPVRVFNNVFRGMGWQFEASNTITDIDIWNNWMGDFMFGVWNETNPTLARWDNRLLSNGTLVAEKNKPTGAVSKPQYTIAPQLSTDQPLSGTAVTVNTGSWTGAPSFTYQWQLNGVNVSAANGGTANTFTPATGDQGKTLSLILNATNAGGTTTVTLGPTSTIQAPAVTPPPPTGTVSAGSLLYVKGQFAGPQAVTLQSPAAVAGDLLLGAIYCGIGTDAVTISPNTPAWGTVASIETFGAGAGLFLRDVTESTLGATGFTFTRTGLNDLDDAPLGGRIIRIPGMNAIAGLVSNAQWNDDGSLGSSFASQSISHGGGILFRVIMWRGDAVLTNAVPAGWTELFKDALTTPTADRCGGIQVLYQDPASSGTSGTHNWTFDKAPKEVMRFAFEATP